MNLPVACTLSTPELHEREQTVLAKVRARVQEVRDLDSGYALRFDPEGAMLADLATLIELERQCCPFLRFELRGAPRERPHLAGAHRSRRHPRFPPNHPESAVRSPRNQA